LLKGDGALADLVEADLQARQDTRPMAIGFLRKLRGAGGVPATFDGETALRARRLELFNLRHPLIHLAVDYHSKTRGQGALPVADLRINPAALSPSFAPWPAEGRYAFAVFLLSVDAAQPQTRLVPVAFDASGRRAPACEDRLLRLLQHHAIDLPGATWDAEDRDALLRQATIAISGEADRVAAEVTEKNEGVIAVRRATLERTTRARIERHRRVLASVLDERIQRLHVARIRNLEAELARRIGELESRRQVAVTSAPVGIGRIEIAAAPTAADIAARPAVEPAAAVGERRIDGFVEPPSRFA
jgi:hypothetical protein